ncbi:DUF1707 domain-containing protein [Thalassotalea agarivorans]|uniref:DUF1707 domain-containing protein n=1 Tax=Thalassotalea agarivorans TaxID=349064 RepID=A0A1I0FH46_THASX|nr:LiaF domain-containing protein [Thalassotalea agarivorans]SET57439.1 protein of unknown function [Thalassotalea agarivorans]
MSVKINDRPTEKVREEVIDRLIMNYGHGELSYEAFNRRLDEAMDTQNNETLQSLVEDLPLTPDEQYIRSKTEENAATYVSEGATEEEHIVSIFSGSDRGGRWVVPKKLKVTTVFGGGDLNFSEAVFSQQQTEIEVFCLFGGVDIHVPEGVNVVSRMFNIFGGVSNNTNNAIGSQANVAPTIVVTGYCIFSGVNIRIPRSIKERFVSFADEFKKMFIDSSGKY